MLVRLVTLLLYAALAVACGHDEPPARARGDGAAPSREDRAPPPPPAAPIPTAWILPDGWVWVTVTSDGYAIGLPALPRSARNAERTMHVLVSETPSGTVTVVRRSDALDAAQQIRAAAARAGQQIAADEPFRGTGRRIDLDSPAASEMNVLLEQPGGATMLVNAVVPRGQELDVGSLFESLTFDDLTAARRIRDPEGHFVLDAPSRMDPMGDRSAPPPVLGVHGILDGDQMSVIFVPVGAGPTDAAALAAQVQAKVGAMPGEVVSSEERTVGGRTERWVHCRALDGSPTVGALRMFFARGQLYTAAVFSPSGQEPRWAQRFLGSLEVEP